VEGGAVGVLVEALSDDVDGAGDALACGGALGGAEDLDLWWEVGFLDDGVELGAEGVEFVVEGVGGGGAGPDGGEFVLDACDLRADLFGEEGLDVGLALVEDLVGLVESFADGGDECECLLELVVSCVDIGEFEGLEDAVDARRDLFRVDADDAFVGVGGGVEVAERGGGACEADEDAWVVAQFGAEV